MSSSSLQRPFLCVCLSPAPIPGVASSLYHVIVFSPTPCRVASSSTSRVSRGWVPTSSPGHTSWKYSPLLCFFSYYYCWVCSACVSGLCCCRDAAGKERRRRRRRSRGGGLVRSASPVPVVRKRLRPAHLLLHLLVVSGAERVGRRGVDGGRRGGRRRHGRVVGVAAAHQHHRGAAAASALRRRRRCAAWCGHRRHPIRTAAMLRVPPSSAAGGRDHGRAREQFPTPDIAIGTKGPRRNFLAVCACAYMRVSLSNCNRLYRALLI